MGTYLAAASGRVCGLRNSALRLVIFIRMIICISHPRVINALRYKGLLWRRDFGIFNYHSTNNSLIVLLNYSYPRLSDRRTEYKPKSQHRLSVARLIQPTSETWQVFSAFLSSLSVAVVRFGSDFFFLLLRIPTFSYHFLTKNSLQLRSFYSVSL